MRRIQASFRKRCNSLSGLQVGEKAIQTFLCVGSRLPFGSGAIPFRVCKLTKGDPNVSVRRIDASFRKRSNSLRETFDWRLAPRMLCRRPVWPKWTATWFCKTGIVGDMHLVLCVLPVVRPEMPVIFAGLDHKTVWRFTGAVLGQGFSISVVVLRVSWSRQCFTQFWRFSAVAVLHSRRVPVALPSCSVTCGRRPLFCRMCSFPGGLQFLDTLTTCPLLVTTGV